VRDRRLRAPYLRMLAELPAGSTGGFDHELLEEFFRAVANNAKLTVHLEVEAAGNAHHMIEAAFKAFARALRARSRSTRPSRRPEHQGGAVGGGGRGRAAARAP
jgi:imidazoleglycerol phosphate dehydratase HisB